MTLADEQASDEAANKLADCDIFNTDDIFTYSDKLTILAGCFEPRGSSINDLL